MSNLEQVIIKEIQEIDSQIKSSEGTLRVLEGKKNGLQSLLEKATQVIEVSNTPMNINAEESDAQVVQIYDIKNALNGIPFPKSTHPTYKADTFGIKESGLPYILKAKLFEGPCRESVLKAHAKNHFNKYSKEAFYGAVASGRACGVFQVEGYYPGRTISLTDFAMELERARHE